MKNKIEKNKINTENMDTSVRLSIPKTYKLYIGGKFPRTESGHYFQIKNKDKIVANMCRSSRKDFRNAVRAARNAFASDWSKKFPFTRGHIIYRIAEMLEGRKLQFIEELVALGINKSEAEMDVTASIDRIIYYAGWSDKYQQIFSSVNPVSSPHFNFSNYEPMGVVSILAPEKGGLLGLINSIIPVIVGGNSCIVVPSASSATLAINFAEVLHTSDVPGGVVNILTGFGDELYTHMASHMDVNAIVYCGENITTIKNIQEIATSNLKRIIIHNEADFKDKANPYLILDTQELKTTWHPIGN